ncbi:MAG: sialate O-acetylesterase [Caulobacteraceae bacterium]|nr:sialate O-acetylesterase [Caulobacter sp.]
MPSHQSQRLPKGARRPPRPAHRRGRALAVAAAATVITAAPASAELRLPHVLSDHAVLQRERPIHIWGWAAPGERVDAELHGVRAAATADRLGRWEVWLPPQPAGGPYGLSIHASGGETRRLADVMIGDVWFASGQSNMEMPLAGFPPTAHVKNAAAEIAAATNAHIRLLKVGHASSDHPLRDTPDSWTTCAPASAAQFSAIGYFFARTIAAREHVTVGVIDSSWGGTPADPWVSLQGLSADPALLPAFAARARFARDLADSDAIAAADARDDAQARARGLPAPEHPWRPEERSWAPGALYNAMVAPFTAYGLKGVIWYQGETNSAPDRAPYYADLFKALIADWRADFAQGDLPFVYAQISSFNSPKEDWGEVRDAQRRALALRATAMAVTTDVGNPANVHPSDKQTVAARLALGAEAIAYGEAVAYASPLMRQVTREGSTLRAWFDHADGLTSRGAAVTGFEVAGPDHAFAPAAAVISGTSVAVTAPSGVEPLYLRYNWSNVTTGALYNAAGLPASTFTSER